MKEEFYAYSRVTWQSISSMIKRTIVAVIEIFSNGE